MVSNNFNKSPSLKSKTNSLITSSLPTTLPLSTPNCKTNETPSNAFLSWIITLTQVTAKSRQRLCRSHLSSKEVTLYSWLTLSFVLFNRLRNSKRRRCFRSDQTCWERPKSLLQKHHLEIERSVKLIQRFQCQKYKNSERTTSSR